LISLQEYDHPFIEQASQTHSLDLHSPLLSLLSPAPVVELPRLPRSQKAQLDDVLANCSWNGWLLGGLDSGLKWELGLRLGLGLVNGGDLKRADRAIFLRLYKNKVPFEVRLCISFYQLTPPESACRRWSSQTSSIAFLKPQRSPRKRT
jgi:hypothetical protein